VERWFQRWLRGLGDLPLQIVLPHEARINLSDKPVVATIHIRDHATLCKLAMDPLYHFGEGFANDRISIEGDLVECLTLVFGAMNAQTKPSWWQGLLYRIRRPAANSLRRSKKNICHHYDLSNDFYRSWLDDRMLYTCAYFADHGMSLEEAQLAKMDHVCRKLRLKPGDRVVEAGCGWGALAMHMAEHYGVHVRAYNISNAQLEWARRQAYERGLTPQVEFVLGDWREITGEYDAFASVGMLEHVGVANYRLLGQVIRRCLKSEGWGLIHSIGQNRPLPMNPWIERNIFPGAYTPTLAQMGTIFEAADLQILDVENLRLHYAETLRHWLDRFEQTSEQVAKQFDARFVRAWRLYLAGSVAAFASGCLQLYQVVFAAPSARRIPRTRKHLYVDETPTPSFDSPKSV
jgi:cyclopropane-fatty-acyl-phospholipid synthase